MDKSWITKDRLSKEYEEGVDNFAKLALENTTDPSRVHCPCRKCSNLKKLDIMEIKSHLYFNGMDQTYVKWFGMEKKMTLIIMFPMKENNLIKYLMTL